MRAVLLSLLIAALLAAPAQGATEVAAGPDVAFGDVHAAGPDTVFTDGDFRTTRIYAVREGERPRLLERVGSRGRGVAWLETAASPSRLIYLSYLEREEGEDFERLYSRVGAGPLDADHPLVQECENNDDPTDAVAAGGDAVAWAGSCTAPGQITVEDPAGRRTFTVAGSPRLLRLAGPYLAYQAAPATPAIVVIDHRTGVEVYRVPVDPDPGFQVGDTYPFDLQADGTVVVLGRHVDEERRLCTGSTPIRVASPAQPAPPELPAKACLADVSIGGGRIAFAREAPGATGDVAQIVTADLAGGDLRPVAQLSAARLGGFDWDGTRTSWETQDCPGSTIRTQAGPEGAIEPPGPTSCPAKILSRRLKVDRRGRVAVRVRCKRGCAGSLILRGAGTRVRDAKLAVGRGATKTVRVRLTRRARRNLARGPRMRRVSVAVFAGDVTGALRTRAFKRLPLRVR